MNLLKFDLNIWYVGGSFMITPFTSFIKSDISMGDNTIVSDSFAIKRYIHISNHSYGLVISIESWVHKLLSLAGVSGPVKSHPPTPSLVHGAPPLAMATLFMPLGLTLEFVIWFAWAFAKVFALRLGFCPFFFLRGVWCLGGHIVFYEIVYYCHHANVRWPYIHTYEYFLYIYLHWYWPLKFANWPFRWLALSHTKSVHITLRVYIYIYYCNESCPISNVRIYIYPHIDMTEIWQERVSTHM